MRAVFILVICSLVLCGSTVSAQKSKLFISPNGTDTPSCGQRNDPCRTLDHVYELLLPSGFNSTVLLLDKGEYNLQKSLTFENVKDFSLFGGYDEFDSNVYVEITCEQNASLAFFLSENITLQGLKLFNCGGWQDAVISSPNATVFKFKTAIHFDYCRNVWMHSVHVSRSVGLAANFYEMSGVLEVTNCVFENNTAGSVTSIHSMGYKEKEQIETRYIITGGGIFLKLNNYSRRFTNVTQADHETYVHGNKYVFTNCSFLGNNLTRGPVSSANFQETFDHPFSSSGGGLGIVFVGNASKSTVLIRNCTFLANHADWGGGLMVEFAGSTSRNDLLVEESVFERNFGYSAGGGARVGNMLPKGVALPMNKVRFVNSLFRDNWGKWGGGVSVYGTSIFCKCKDKFNTKSIFSFHSCRWLGNSATVGSAIATFLFNHNSDHIGPELPFHVEFIHCQVEKNQVKILEKNVRIGEGAIYSVDVSIIFRGNTTITNNSFTALALDSGTVELHDNVEFVGNRGFRGGAVAMYGNSRVILMKGSRLFFKQNSCTDKGGAMFIQAPGSPQMSYGVTGKSLDACFFAYENSWRNFDNWDTQVIFQDNRAPDNYSGHSVFATSLKKCRKPGETRLNNSVLDWKFIKFIRTSDKTNGSLNRNEREIATDPIDIFFSKDDWHVAPSEVFSPVVQLRDEKNNSVRGIINVLVTNSSKGDDSSSVHLQTSSSLFVADGNISRLKLGGDVGGEFTVVLQHVGRQILQKTIHGASLKKCNPGFYLEDGSCVCHKQLDSVSRCDQNGKTVYLKRGYWAGMVDGNFSTYPCPHDFCNCPRNHDTTSLAQDECVFIAEEMCRGNRDPDSILCGKCKQGFSVVLGFRDCYECEKYYVIAICLAIIFGLIMLTMVLDIDAVTGSLNGCLYFYQVVWQIIGERFVFKDHFMFFIISLFNFRLSIGTPFCLLPHLDYADKLFYQLFIPTFTLFTAVVLAKLVGKYPNWCFSRRVKAPFRAMCTISVLCYTGITSACLEILHPVVIGDRTVLHLSGSTHFFRGKHAVYGSIAVLFVVFFVLPFPLILMFRPFFTRCLQPLLNLNRFKPIFDVLQSCFKDQHRWFASFYFICRLVVLVIYTYVPSGPVRRSLLEVTCIMILFIFAYVRPYKRSEQEKDSETSPYVSKNKSDAVLLLNLSLMAVFSSATQNDNIRESHKAALTVFIQILAYVPVVVLAWSLYRKTRAYCGGQCCNYDDDPEIPPISETVTYEATTGTVRGPNRLSKEPR